METRLKFKLGDDVFNLLYLAYRIVNFNHGSTDSITIDALTEAYAENPLHNTVSDFHYFLKSTFDTLSDAGAVLGSRPESFALFPDNLRLAGEIGNARELTRSDESYPAWIGVPLKTVTDRIDVIVDNEWKRDNTLQIIDLDDLKRFVHWFLFEASGTIEQANIYGKIFARAFLSA